MNAVSALGLVIGLAIAAPAPKNTNVLTATIKAGPKEDSVEVEYRNSTGEAVRIDKLVMESGILALEVLDAKSRFVPTVPPPIPRVKTEFITILPGSSHKQVYGLSHFSPPLPAGKYLVRVRIQGWKSSEFSYEVKDAK